MKFYVYPADQFGCGYFRLIWPAQVLQAMGHDVVIVKPGEGNLRGQVDANGNTIAVSAPKDADAIIMQRITHRQLSQGIKIWRARGIAVIMDMDDDLQAINPNNPAWAALHPTQGKAGFDWRVSADAARDCTLLTTSTPELAARYGQHGRTQVLRNCVPAFYLTNNHQDSEVVGWGGSVASHPGDLEVMGSAMNKLTESGVHFRVVGPDWGVEKAAGVRSNWSATGSLDMGDWPGRLAQELGVGVAPLADTRFNHAKSWLKPLEYAALGIPAVMSPTPEYSMLNKLGVGRLCRKPKEWERTCRELVRDAGLREHLSQKGREVASVLTYEQRAWQWAEAWTRAVEWERSQPRPVRAS